MFHVFCRSSNFQALSTQLWSVIRLSLKTQEHSTLKLLSQCNKKFRSQFNVGVIFNFTKCWKLKWFDTKLTFDKTETQECNKNPQEWYPINHLVYKSCKIAFIEEGIITPFRTSSWLRIWLHTWNFWLVEQWFYLILSINNKCCVHKY